MMEAEFKPSGAGSQYRALFQDVLWLSHVASIPQVVGRAGGQAYGSQARGAE